MIALPPLLHFQYISAYRSHFIRHYCNTQIKTFDKIVVRFFPENFNHAFYRDSSPMAKDKSNFDTDRAQRVDWIKAVLADPNVEIYQRVMQNAKIRRIALEPTIPYVVIIQIDTRNSFFAKFVTAYVVSSQSVLGKIRSNPRLEVPRKENR